MAFFFRFMQPLIEAGHLYLGLSPLYRVQFGTGAKAEQHWVYSDEEKDALLKQARKNQKISITRFKGLGEMNPKTLWNTTLNPRARKLLRIGIDDLAATEDVFTSLLGKDTESRYRMIQDNADRLEVDV